MEREEEEEMTSGEPRGSGRVCTVTASFPSCAPGLCFKGVGVYVRVTVIQVTDRWRGHPGHRTHWFVSHPSPHLSTRFLA